MSEAITEPNGLPTAPIANGDVLTDSKTPVLTSAQETAAISNDTTTNTALPPPFSSEPDIDIPTGTTGTPLKTPLLKPQSSPPPPANLTGEQESKYAQVLAKVSTWTTLPSSTAKTATQEPITDHERMWLTRECLLRYLRATKWNTPAALKRLQGTLSWRREYGADTFTYDYISPENETGKQVILGFDKDARPCLYLNPGKQNTEMSDRQIHHLCFMLDRTIDMMPPGGENACLIINFKGAAGGKIPTVAQARAVLNILQNHNPERLGRALISDLPWYVNTFFKLISPFIDPVTREKMKFNPVMRDHVPENHLWNQQSGELNFEYDHAVYWPALKEITDRRRERLRQRWELGGKLIGESEEYLRGGEHLSLKQELESYGGSAEASSASSQVDVLAKGVDGITVQ